MGRRKRRSSRYAGMDKEEMYAALLSGMVPGYGEEVERQRTLGIGEEDLNQRMALEQRVGPQHREIAAARQYLEAAPTPSPFDLVGGSPIRAHKTYEYHPSANPRTWGIEKTRKFNLEDEPNAYAMYMDPNNPENWAREPGLAWLAREAMYTATPDRVSGYYIGW